jgi:hypothetical protein
VAEAEHYTQIISNSTHAWLTSTVLSGYEGSSYLHALPDIDVLIPTEAITDSPTTFYPIHFTTPGTYTVWSRVYADNADADAMYVGLNGQVTNITGFEPEQWDWANQQMPSGEAATLSIETGGVYTLTATMYEDGLRLDRLLLRFLGPKAALKLLTKRLSGGIVFSSTTMTRRKMENQSGMLTLPRTGQLQIEVHLSAEVNVTAAIARRKVNAFLATNVGNLLLADEPVLTLGERIVWRVPVDLTAPPAGRLGRVGEVDVDVENGELLLDEDQITGIREHAHRLVTGSPL